MRLLFVFVFLYLLAPTMSLAASLYIDPATATVFRGDAISAAIRIMPDKESDECINAVDITVSYSESIQPVDVSVGKSIISVWLETPVIDKENRTIHLAGGIPNGYCGRIEGDPRMTNIIAEIIFRSPGFQIGGGDDNTHAELTFADTTQVLLNDGQGTVAPLVTYPSTITLDKKAGNMMIDPWRDSVQADSQPPEEFSLTLTKDDTTFSGKYYIVFSTTDKQTGLSHYEVMEEPISNLGRFAWGGVGVPWIKATSPYVVSDQSLNSVVYVKAIDKSGNEYVTKLVPDPSLRTTSPDVIITYVLWGAVAFVGLLAMIGFVWLAFRFTRRRKTRAQNDDDDVKIKLDND